MFKKKVLFCVLFLYLSTLAASVYLRGEEYINTESFDRARKSIVESSNINRKNEEEQHKLRKSIRNLVEENGDLRKSIGELRESTSGIKSSITSSQSISKNIGTELNSVDEFISRSIEINRTIQKRFSTSSNGK